MLLPNGKDYKIINGNSLDALDTLEENSITSIITDPPYELGFMGKGWDKSGIAYNVELWKKALRVLKPGGFLLAFGGSRTYHRIAVAIEDAGFEIRDTIMWIYGSGFPKSMDVGKAIDKRNGVQPIGRKEPTGGITGGKNTGAEEKGWHSINNWYEYPECQNEWKGWGTALKPSFEPIIIARKPFKGSLVDNVIKNGVGGINIDECRVGNEERTQFSGRSQNKTTVYNSFNQENAHYETVQGRFPANTILTYDETDFDEVCGGFPITKSNGGKTSMPDLRDVGRKSKEAIGIDKLSFGQVSNVDRKESNYIAPCDSGSASRYFYCAKASKKDRDEGLDGFEDKKFYSTLNTKNGSGERLDGGTTPIRKNTHPTVKPTELMQYLVRLVTPNNGVVLDPFNGSGSTGKAVMYENKERNKNYKYIGIELTEEYLPIAKARIEYVCNQTENK